MNDKEKWELTEMLRKLQAEVDQQLADGIGEILDRFVGTRLPPPPSDTPLDALKRHNEELRRRSRQKK